MAANSAGLPGETTRLRTSQREEDSKKMVEEDEVQPNQAKRRNLAGFWILGLCNNFGYVVMLSAAHDILDPKLKAESPLINATKTMYTNGSGNGSTSGSDGLGCNPLSTGTVLLADILPALILKATAPFYVHRLSYHSRIAACIVFSFVSFFLVAFSSVLWLSLLGVISASISSGFGEITILSFSAHFNKDVVSTWSSGTGAAGLFGALSYAGLITTGLSPRDSILVMNIVPVLFGVSFWWILVYPPHLKLSFSSLYSPLTDSANESTNYEYSDRREISKISFCEKLEITKSLLKYMVPLFFVYFAEYFINQGLHELIFWNGIWLSPAAQYRWYQVDYQLGVLISRSSVNIFPIKNIIVLTLLQYVNLLVLVFEAYFHFMPSVWIMLAIVLFEGLLGGGVYVNAFYRISEEVKPAHREFCMGVTSVADSCGIALAGVTSLPTHNALCRYWSHKQIR